MGGEGGGWGLGGGVGGWWVGGWVYIQCSATNDRIVNRGISGTGATISHGTRRRSGNDSF